MTKFAVKRLAAVEIQPKTSNQHELNAGKLRRGLGFPEGRSEGPLRILSYVGPDEDPEVLEGQFTLYDAREHHPARSEYRLYYRLPGLMEVAKPDDLLALYRDVESGGLQGVLARPGTRMERHLERLLRAGDKDALRSLVVRTPSPSPADAGEWVQTLLPIGESTDLATAARIHPLFSAAVNQAALPATRLMAGAGQEIAAAVWGALPDPDEYMRRSLDSESELYFAIERELGTRSLNALLGKGSTDLDELLAWALRIQQSRKARRGQSLQHHFSYLLDRDGIPYTAQCVTEGGETPDFVIPGHAQYHDSRFPPDRLRMVACKSRVRERWGQILKEADRIQQKFLLTVDDSLSADVLRSMDEVELRVFLPAHILHGQYSSNTSKALLSTVGQLIGCLRLVL